MTKVSIVTPAYNATHYLKETVSSVQAQTFPDWEMIIVDDCSKDDTYKLACSLAKEDKRIKVIQHGKNEGVAAARNTALDASSGDYIAFLDSDDLWMPDKLEKQLAFMESNDYALTYTMYQKFQTDAGQRGKIIKAPKKMTANAIYGNTSIGCLTVIVNRKKVGAFHMPLIGHTEDNCTWQEILSRGYVAYGLNENLALYRESNNSLTGNKKKAAKQQWQTYREYYKFPVIKSTFYFVCYAFNAVKKHL
ncbi:MAG: glycosyltransferase family 2 protein [Eubacteriales bacterium]|nr:glycosyltransferase family 2 protein [Eubacteriales bacterium]